MRYLGGFSHGVISYMKDIVKRILAMFGYRLVRKEMIHIPDIKYVSLLNAFAENIRNDHLPSMPVLSREQALLTAELAGINEAQAFFLLDALSRSLQLDGDICEFGVAQGATSALIAESIRATTKRLWLFDSFEGLPSPSKKDLLLDDILGLGSIERYKGQMSCPESQVLERLGKIKFPNDRVEIVRGFVETSLLADRVPTKVAFAFVDLDFYEPIRTVLHYLDRVLVPEGIVLVHDYGFLSTGVKTAVDEFFESNQARYSMDFPSGPIRHCCLLQRRV